ncbi:MAG: dihydrolipoamide acetyltransferase family protein [bacterium]
MRTEVVMPQMGESIAEATLTQWLKSPGDTVERDEPLFEITTDKVDAEIPSPVKGVLVEIRVEPGQTVEINHIVAVIDSTAGAVVTTGVASAAPAPAAAQDVAVGKAVPVAHVPKVEASADATVEELRRTKSTPLVRRIAAEHGIKDLSAISGSGLSGRVTKQDILSFIESGAHKSAPATAKPASQGRDYQLPPVAVGERDRIEILSPQRLAIAKHMIASRATSAHAQTVHEVDFAAVAKAKKAMAAEFAERGVRLTYTAFLVKALGEALAAFPMVNSSMDGDSIVYRGDINIGMAVDVGESLIVPVIRNVDELSLLGVARAVTDLAERARTKKLKPEDVKGGTFTLTNPGIFGSEFGVPIINQPQTAILATGAIKKRVVVDQETDAIMVRPTSIWCMSFDHRVVDGATADRFVLKLREIIENYAV